MRAAICREFGKPFEIAEVTLAPPGPGEVRARVAAVAICHSDVTYADGGWGGDLPAVYGHEAAGVVTEVGAGVTDFVPGDRVVITLVRNCGTCPCCARNMRGSCETQFPLDAKSPLSFADGGPIKHGLRTGAFAEEVVVEQSQLVKIGPEIGFDVASLLACGVITGYGAVVNTAALPPGKDVVVIGTGGVGLNAVQGAALTGSKRVIAIDLDDKKLAAATVFGASDVINGADGAAHRQVRALTGGRGADYVFVTVGVTAAMDQSYRMLAPGGASVLVGMADLTATSTFNPLALSDSSRRILGSKMGQSDIRADIPALIGLYRAGKLKLDELISHRYPFDEINTAMDNVRNGVGLRNVLVFGDRGMKLADCEVFVVGNPPPRKGGRYFIFVKLTTDDGITGIGEVYAATFGPHVVAEMVRDVFARHFEGADPHRIEHLWRLTYGSGYTARPDASLMGVLSGLEIACWDIVGKAAGQPVYNLLGGKCRERVRSYTYIYPKDGDVYPDPNAPSVYNDADMAAERAADYLAMGFTALKFDPAGPYTVYDGHQPRMEDLERSGEFCKKLREAVGTRADLLFGTHGQFTTSGAKRLARRIEPYEPLWFEEPTPAEMPEQMAEVARSTSIPIATGERLTTKYEFARVLACGAASILQPALGRVGGILEAKKIAAMAEAHYAQMAPHLYCGPVEGAANIQLAACIPNFLVLKSIERFEGFHGEIVKGIRWEEGHVIPSSEPGLGIAFDEDVARAHPYVGDALHLEMGAGEVTP